MYIKQYWLIISQYQIFATLVVNLVGLGFPSSSEKSGFASEQNRK